jgi:hypothetical protein
MACERSAVMRAVKSRDTDPICDYAGAMPSTQIRLPTQIRLAPPIASDPETGRANG